MTRELIDRSRATEGFNYVQPTHVQPMHVQPMHVQPTHLKAAAALRPMCLVPKRALCWTLMDLWPPATAPTSSSCDLGRSGHPQVS
eukprot:1148707-Pelagomonas_calceolata.AAC.4